MKPRPLIISILSVRRIRVTTSLRLHASLTIPIKIPSDSFHRNAINLVEDSMHVFLWENHVGMFVIVYLLLLEILKMMLLLEELNTILSSGTPLHLLLLVLRNCFSLVSASEASRGETPEPAMSQTVFHVLPPLSVLSLLPRTGRSNPPNPEKGETTERHQLFEASRFICFLSIY